MGKWLLGVAWLLASALVVGAVFPEIHRDDVKTTRELKEVLQSWKNRTGPLDEEPFAYRGEANFENRRHSRLKRSAYVPNYNGGCQIPGYTGQHCEFPICDFMTSTPTQEQQVVTVDYGSFANATVQMPFFVDMLMVRYEIEIVASLDVQPSFVVKDMAGNVISPTQVENEGRAKTVGFFNDANPGTYVISTTAEDLLSTVEIVVTVRALTALQVGIGFIGADANNGAPERWDNVTSRVKTGYPAMFAAKSWNLRPPGALTSFSILYDHAQQYLSRPQPLRIRYGCEYEYFFESIYCNMPGSYLAKVEGTDFMGQSFSRIQSVVCEVGPPKPSGPPTPPPPPITNCSNGGLMITGDDGTNSCFCEGLFTGRDCSTPLCLHGGKLAKVSPSSKQQTCICTADAPYGNHCERIKCVENTNVGAALAQPPYLVLVVRVRKQLSDMITQIAAQLTVIKSNLQFDPEYLQKIVLVTFNNEVSGSKLFNSVDGVVAELKLLAATQNTTGACEANVISAIVEVFEKYALTLKSPIYIFTDAIPNDLHMLERAYAYNGYFYAPLYFMLLDTKTAEGCQITDKYAAEYRAMERLSVRSGGMVFGPLASDDLGGFFRSHVYATFYRTELVYANDLRICGNQLALQTIAVDQNLEELVIIAQGENLTLSLLNPSGKQATFTVSTSLNYAYLWSVRGPRVGQWSFNVIAANPGTPCQYRAYAGVHKDNLAKDREFKMIWGFTNNDINDAPLRYPIFGQPLNLVVHVENYHIAQPQYANAEVAVYANHHSGRELEFAANSIWRDRCGYEIKFPDFTCWHPDEDLYFNLYFRDRHGNTVQRSGHFICAYVQPTTVPPKGCQNGGVNLNGTCLCTPFWEGKHCEVRRCMNGGTLQGGVLCDCLPGHVGPSCERTSCIAEGNAPPRKMGNFDRAFVVMLDMSRSAILMLDQIRDQFTTVFRDIPLHHRRWITSYVVVGYNSTWNGVLASTNQPDKAIAAIAQADTLANLYQDPSCSVQMWQALRLATDYAGENGYINIFQAALPDDTSTYPMAESYGAITIRRIRVNAFMAFKLKDQPWCNGTNSTYDDLTQLVSYTEGQLYPINYFSFKHALATLPAMFSQSLVDRHEPSDCATKIQSFYVPVDSFTQSLQITVFGNQATVNAYKPNGKPSDLMTTVVDDEETGAYIYDVRKRCDDQWKPLGKQPYCTMFGITPKTWDDAQLFCQDSGGFLIDATYKDKDTFLDQGSDKKDIWIGLNDEQKNGAWVWDRGNWTAEPLQTGNKTYSNWGPGQPTNNANLRCVSRQFKGADTAQWYATNCTEKRFFVCQKHKYTDKFAPNKIDDDDLPAGKWRFDIQTVSTGDPAYSSCYYEARVQSKIGIYTGYSTNEHSDQGKPFPIAENPNNIILAHLSGDVVSARMPRLTYAMIFGWTNDSNSLAAGVTYGPRENCQYEFYSQSFSCPKGNAFTALHTGEDEYGVAFQRLTNSFCEKASPFCGNGGIKYQGQCVCDEFWTGAKCDIPVCLNGGKLMTNSQTCKCLPGFVGDACQFPICTPPVPVNFKNANKTFAVVIENTAANSDAASALKTHLEKIINAANQGKQWFSNYVLLTFSANVESVVYSTTDLKEYISRLTASLSSPDRSQAKCIFPIYERLAQVMNSTDFVNMNSVIHVVTRGLPAVDKGPAKIFMQLAAQTRAQLFVYLIKDPSCKVDFSGVSETAIAQYAYMMNGNLFYLPGTAIAEHMALYLPAVYGSSVLSTPTIFNNKCSQLSVPLQIDSATTNVFISLYANKYSPIGVTDPMGNAVNVTLQHRVDATSILTFGTKKHPGIYTFTVNSDDPTCMVQVRGQSGPQVFAGFVTGAQNKVIHNDATMANPLPNVNNTLVAHASIFSRLTMVEMFGSSEMFGTTHLQFVHLSPRWDCAYEYYSEPFQCPAAAFLAYVHGIDSSGEMFRRETFFSCQGLTNTTVPTEPSVTVSTPTTTPKTPKNVKVDVMILVDTSNDMSNATYESELVNFITSTFNFFDMSQNGLNFGIFSVDGNDGYQIDMRYPLGPLNTPEVLKSKLAALGDAFISTSNGQEYLKDTLNMLASNPNVIRDPAYTSVNNRVVIYVTAKSSPSAEAIKIAQGMRSAGQFGFLSVAYQSDGSNTNALQSFTGGSKCSFSGSTPVDLTLISSEIQQKIWVAAQADNAKYC